MSVDLPSSTEPQVFNRRISMGCWVWGMGNFSSTGKRGAACVTTEDFGLRWEAKRHAALEVCWCLESGVAATLCHRTPNCPGLLTQATVGRNKFVFICVHLWLKVSRLLAVFHRRFAGLIVGAGTAFGHTRGGDFGDDVVHGIRRRLDQAGADDVDRKSTRLNSSHLGIS